MVDVFDQTIFNINDILKDSSITFELNDLKTSASNQAEMSIGNTAIIQKEEHILNYFVGVCNKYFS